MPGEDEDISAALAAAFTANGIEVITGISGVDAITRDDRGLRLTYRAGDRPVDLDVESVMLAVGWPGNLDDLRLEEAGVATDRGYIKVDDRLHTSAPHIWAAGDITGRMMLVQSATYEGRIAAENAARRRGSRAAPHDRGARWLHRSRVRVRRPHRSRRALRRREIVIGKVSYGDLDRAVIDRRTDGFAKLVVDPDTHRVLGAHVIGEQAVEVVQIAATAMAAEMPVEQLAEIEFAYPTFTSIIGLAARQVVHALRLGGEAEAWESMGRPRQAEWERRDP